MLKLITLLSFERKSIFPTTVYVKATCIKKRMIITSENKTALDRGNFELCYNLFIIGDDALSAKMRNKDKQRQNCIHMEVKVNESPNKNDINVTCFLFHMYVHERHKCIAMDRTIEPCWGNTGAHARREVESLFSAAPTILSSSQEKRCPGSFRGWKTVLVLAKWKKQVVKKVWNASKSIGNSNMQAEELITVQVTC